MSHGPPRILFLTLSDDIGSERVVSEIGRLGAACAVMGRPGAMAGRSLRVSLRHDLPSHGGLWFAAVRVKRALEAVASDWRPDAVVPLDDMAAGVLRDIATAPRTGAELRDLIVRSLGDPRHFRTACSRARLIEAAAGLGLRTPRQHALHGTADAAAAAADLGYPLMVKREGTCGGSGVTLVGAAGGLSAAVRAASGRARAKRALCRLVGFRPDRDGAAVTLQAHVAGALAMRTVACSGGRVLDGLSLAAEHIDPPVTGSSTVVRPLDHPEMEAAARRLVAALGLSGFASFDFILSPDGAAHLIEMNARPVGSGHLGRRFGHDLYGAWLRDLSGPVPDDENADTFPSRYAARAAARVRACQQSRLSTAGIMGEIPLAAAVARPSAVALFPKELRRDPDSPHVAAPGVLHDVPWDEPLILDAYRARLLARHPGAASAVARALGPAHDAPDPRRRRAPTALEPDRLVF